jgi:hypothetical protein
MPDHNEPDDGDDIFMIEDISPEDWQCRQVYAKFGAAMFQGQALEHEIVNLIVWSGVSDGTYSSYKETQTANVKMFSETMGVLKQVLISRRIDLANLEDDLVRAVGLRNFLAHSYFRERAAAFITHEGRERMIAELDSSIEFFIKVDAELTSFTREIIGSRGLLDTLPESREAVKGQGFGQPLPGLS